MNLKKQLDLINSEGTILGLYHSIDNEIFVSSLMNDSDETIYFKVDDHEIRMYVNGYITLQELYNFSNNFFIVTKSGKVKKTYLFEQYECSLKFGNLCYDEISREMKPSNGLDKFNFEVNDE